MDEGTLLIMTKSLGKCVTAMVRKCTPELLIAMDTQLQLVMLLIVFHLLVAVELRHFYRYDDRDSHDVLEL